MSLRRSRFSPRLPNERLGNALAIALASSVAVAFVITVVVKASNRSQPPRQLASAQSSQSGQARPTDPTAATSSIRGEGTGHSTAVDPPSLPKSSDSKPAPSSSPSPTPSGAGRLGGSQAPLGPAGSGATRSVAGTGSHSGSTTPTPSPIGPTETGPSRSTTTSASATPSASAPTEPPVESSQTYNGPGGITVTTDPGWVFSPTSTTSVSEFLQPPGTDPLTAAYFGLGIADSAPPSDVSTEADRVIAALQAQDPAVQIVTRAAGQYMGADSVDIEYANFHEGGGPRHGRERLWLARDAAYVVRYDSPESTWDDSELAIFNSLIASCQLANG